MTKKTINVGSAALSGDGEPLRDALIKVNQNFDEVYSDVTELYSLVENYNADANNEIAALSNRIDDLDISQLQDTNSLIPNSVSDLDNDLGYITTEEIPTQLDSPYYTVTERYELGESISFVKIPGVSEFDYIDQGLTLTRDARTPDTDGGGLYNSEIEQDWDATQSPIGLLWNADGWNNLDDVKQRQYVNFRQALKNRIGENIIGLELVAHDTISDKYYTFVFSQWEQGAQHNGIFAYTRRLIDVNKQIGITFGDGSNLISAPEAFSKYPQTYVGDTSAYTFVIEDAGKHIYAFGVTMTLPHYSNVNYPIGSIIKIVAGYLPVKIIAQENVSIYSSSIVEQNNEWTIPANTIATLIKTNHGTTTNPDQWRLSVPYSNKDEIINIIKTVAENSLSFEEFKQNILNL